MTQPAWRYIENIIGIWKEKNFNLSANFVQWYVVTSDVCFLFWKYQNEYVTDPDYQNKYVTDPDYQNKYVTDPDYQYRYV